MINKLKLENEEKKKKIDELMNKKEDVLDKL